MRDRQPTPRCLPVLTSACRAGPLPAGAASSGSADSAPAGAASSGSAAEAVPPASSAASSSGPEPDAKRRRFYPHAEYAAQEDDIPEHLRFGERLFFHSCQFAARCNKLHRTRSGIHRL